MSPTFRAAVLTSCSPQTVPATRRSSAVDGPPHAQAPSPLHRPPSPADAQLPSPRAARPTRQLPPNVVIPVVREARLAARFRPLFCDAARLDVKTRSYLIYLAGPLHIRLPVSAASHTFSPHRFLCACSGGEHRNRPHSVRNDARLFKAPL